MSNLKRAGHGTELPSKERTSEHTPGDKKEISGKHSQEKGETSSKAKLAVGDQASAS